MGGVRGAGRPRAWAEIDLGAFAENVRVVRGHAPAGNLLCVLKADGYGHGAVRLARVARDAGVAALGVGDSTEALELRHAGIQAPVLVLGALVPSEIPLVVASGITPVVHSMGRLMELEEEARRQDRVLPVHLKVDTGLGRLGMQPRKVAEAARAVAGSPHLRLEGLMSHLAGTAGDPRNLAQAAKLSQWLVELTDQGLIPSMIHLRSTSGLGDPGLHVSGETMVRAGAALYGFVPRGATPFSGIRPVLSLHTQVVFLKDVAEGTDVGYGGTFRTRRATRLGILPLGYDDGMPPGLANSGEVLVRGQRAPIVGAISMDYTTIDITEIPGVHVGDEVMVIGSQGEDRISVEEVARRAGAIPYAVLCGLGRRVVRVFLSEKVVAG